MFYRRFATRLCRFFLFFALFCAAPQPGHAGGWEAAFAPLSQPLPLPAVLVKDLHGVQNRLVDLVRPLLNRHRLVILHLWAANCPPCATEMKTLDEKLTALDAENVAILTLAQDPHGLVTVPGFIRRHELRFLPLYVDEGQMTAKALLPRGLPSSFLIDQTGRIVAVHEGAVDWSR